MEDEEMSNEKVERLLGELVRLVRVQVHPVAKQLLREEFFDGDDPKTEQIDRAHFVRRRNAGHGVQRAPRPRSSRARRRYCHV